MKPLSTSGVFAAVMLLGLATGSAQNATPTVLRWNFGAPNAVTDTTHAAKVEGLKTDDVHIYVALYDIKDTEYNRAWVQIVNHGQTSIEFDPQSAVLLQGDKGTRAEVPDKAADSIQRLGEAKSQELSSAHCGALMTGQNNTGGAASVCRPTDTQIQLSKEVLTVSNLWAEFVRSRALKQTTVAPGQQVVGAILFRKGKKPANYMLAVPVGSRTFEFPVSALNNARSYD